MTVTAVPSSSLHIDDDEISKLMQAAKNGHIDTIKPILWGISPDIKDKTGRTAFSWAASYDLRRTPHIHDIDRLLQFLLDRGANPNLGDMYGETPMHWAAKEGDHRMVDLILQNNVLPDMADFRGRTPLSRAAERGQHRVVELLLKKGKVDPDSKDGKGRTPLSWAAENWHLESASTLVDNGASVDIHDKEGQLPLWWFINNTAKRTAMAQQPETKEDFQRWLTVLGPAKHGVEPMTKARRTFLSWACERGDKELVMHLLKTNWADPNSVDRYRKTPLIYALEWYHYDIADMLISGVASDADCQKDIISLRIMIQESRSRLLRLFLERYKPNLEEEDNYNSIPLIRMALQQGDRATVAVLLEHHARIQDLENGDWFGPCSTSEHAADIVVLDNARADSSYNAIPLTRMAIKEGDRAAIATLLGYRAKLLDLEADEDDFQQYSSRRSCASVEIVALKDGTKKVHWILADALDRKIKEMPKTSGETHLMLFRESHRWTTYCQMSNSPNELRFSLGNKSPCRTFTLSILMSLSMADPFPSNDDYNGYADCTIRTIEWAVLEAPPKAIHYFSNLPFGWIPQSDLEFIQLFMRTWREDWTTFCKDARGYLSRLRSHQLTARGKDDSLIDTVAENMRQWTHLRGTLEEQLSQARNFVSQYQKFSETHRFSEQMNETIDALDRDISGQIDKLEQTVRDLLQIEFAWVSINEAHRSTSLATSMKRLSWISFIFLPLTFGSSLLGMNVDVLKDDPSWRWYPLVGGTLLLLTVIAWLCFKFTKMERWVENKTQSFQRKSAAVRGPVGKDLYVI